MRKLLFIFAAVGLGISSTANSQTTYTITGGNWDSISSWSTNATGDPDTKVYDNGETPPGAVVGGNPAPPGLGYTPSDPTAQTGVYSGSITTNDATGEVTAGNLTVTGTIGKEIQVGTNTWWYFEYVNMDIDFGSGTTTGTANCFATVLAPSPCPGVAAGEPASSMTPNAGQEGASGAARPAATFDGTTLTLFDEGYAGAGGTDYMSVFTLTTGAGGPGAAGGDITEAGDILGVGQFALTVDDVTSGVGVDIVNAATGIALSTIEYFDVSASTWDLIAIDTVADANSNGTADDPAIALLAQSQDTGQIVVQTRAVSDGSIVGSWMPFFNNTDWTPIDVAVVNDINGDGTTGDTGIAVLAEKSSNGAYQVRVKLLSNGSRILRQNFFDPSWTASAIEGFTASGGGGSRIAVMAVDGSGKTKAQVRDVSGGGLDISIFAFGAAIDGADLGVIADGNDDGTADDPALLFYGSRVANGNTIYRSRSAASGAHIKTKEMLGTGFTPDGVTSLDSAGASSADDIAGTAVDGSDTQTIKVRDYRNNLTVSDILP